MLYYTRGVQTEVVDERDVKEADVEGTIYGVAYEEKRDLHARHRVRHWHERKRG